MQESHWTQTSSVCSPYVSKCSFLSYSTSQLLPSSLSPNYPNGSRAGLLIVTISRTDNSTNQPHQQKQDTHLTASNELRVILLHRRQNNVYCKHTSESVASFLQYNRTEWKGHWLLQRRASCFRHKRGVEGGCGVNILILVAIFQLSTHILAWHYGSQQSVPRPIIAGVRHCTSEKSQDVSSPQPEL